MQKVILSLALTFFTLSFNFSHAQQKEVRESEFFEGQLIVQTTEEANIDEIIAEYHNGYNFKVDKMLSSTMRAYLVTFDVSKIDHDEAKTLLSRNSGFSIVQNDHKVELRSTVPDDPQFNQQWHHLNTGQTGGTVDADIDSDEAWDITTGGTTATGDNIVVCIIEGVSTSHPDIIDNRWQNPNEIPGNGIDDDGNGYIDDIYGWNIGGNNGNVATGNHGTSCAGMMGAKGDNNLGVSGINWDLDIMVVSGHNANSESNIIACYDYPLQNRILYDQTGGAAGAFVVATSASWGIDGGDPASVPLWCNFYDTLGTYGILNCGATTNQNLNVDVAGDIPTGCTSPYMIGVGRSDHNDNWAGGYGPTTIDLAAPGINVRTTSGTPGNYGYTTTTGTSFACPLTAGAIALLYSAPCPQLMQIVQADPQQGADIVRSALLNGVDVKASMTGNFITDGRLNVNNALNDILNNNCSGTVCLPPSNITLDNANDNDITVSWDAFGSTTDFVLYYQEQGSGTWQNMTVNGTSTNISGLSPCTAYDIYLETDCGSGQFSSPSNTVTMSTSGCGNCVDLSYCAANSDNNDNIDLSVTSPAAIAGNFTHEAPTNWGADLSTTYAAGNLILADDGTAGDSLGCNAFTNAGAINGNIAVIYRGTCQFGTKALNAQNAGAVGVIIINNTAGTMNMGAGGDGPSVNIPVTMISQADGATIKAQLDANETIFGILGTKSEWIETVEIDAYTNNSGDDNGYGDFLIQSGVSVTQGNSYTVNLDPGFQNQPYPIYFRVWIDFDQSGTFDPGELVIDQNNPALTGLSQTVNIPGGASVGSTRMRVMMSYMGPGQTGLPNECGSFNWGEVEDYCLEILPGCGFTTTNNIDHTSCDAAANGSIELTVTGAALPIDYNWSHDATNNTNMATGLASGTYQVVITDDNGCDATYNYTVNETGANITVNDNTVHTTCDAAANGSIEIIATAMATPISYSWSHDAGNSSNTANNLSSGTYDATVTDADGCSETVSITVNEIGADIDYTINTVDASCDDVDDGEVQVIINNAITPVNYSWSHDSGLSGSSATGLSVGNYTVEITDGDGCSEIASYSIGAPAPPVSSFTGQTTDLTITFTNNSSPGTYFWDFDDGNTSTDPNPVHTYAADGTYNVCLDVTDNCTTSTSCNVFTVARDDSSIDEEDPFNIDVYPNPADRIIYFNIEHPDAHKVTLFFISGQIVKEMDVNNQTLEMDVSNLHSGTYFYKITGMDNSIIQSERIQIIK